METFSSFQVRDILNIDYTRLQEWIRRGYIVPSIPAAGRGTKAKFSRSDLYIIQTFTLLLQRGINREIAASMMQKLLCEQTVFWNADIFTYTEKIDSIDKDAGTYSSTMSGGLGFSIDTKNELFRIQIQLGMIKKVVDSMILSKTT